MNGVPRHFDHATDIAAFKRPAHRAGVELYQAHIVRHAFEPHTHDAYGLGAIESGVERFRYRGSEHLAPPDTLVLMNPDELHTGRAETEQGWRYRMVYLDAAVLDALSGADRKGGWWFADAVCHDAARARRVGQLLRSLWATCSAPGDALADALAFDSTLSLLVDELRPSARMAHASRKEGRPRFAPVVDFMRSQLGEVLTLDTLAGVAGLSPFHFLREFKRAHHVTPQQMLMALRLFDAKQRLAAGAAPASVAAASGLTDQAHLTRAFLQRYGVTPGRYQQQLGTRPRRAA